MIYEDKEADNIPCIICNTPLSRHWPGRAGRYELVSGNHFWKGSEEGDTLITTLSLEELHKLEQGPE